MTKTLRILLIGAALVGAAAPAFARGGGGGGGDGGGTGGGSSNAWDPTIAGIQVPTDRTPGATVPTREISQQRDEICGMVRGQRACRPR